MPIDPQIPDSKIRRQYFYVVADALERAGVRAHRLGEEDLQAGRLGDYALVVFPYVHTMDSEAAEQVARYIEGGGKVIACYQLPKRVAEALGVSIYGCQSGVGAQRFAACRLVSEDFPGAPPVFVQHSWHVCLSKPIGQRARVLYEWQDSGGGDSGVPAVIVSRTGAYLSHILTKTDRETKASLLMALVGHFLPGLWPGAADRAVREVGRVGQAGSLAALRTLVARAQEAGRAKEGDERLSEAESLVQKANAALERRHYARAIALAAGAQRLCADAYVRTMPTREVEMRGVWIASPTGIGGWDWDRTIRHLHRMGFNAVFVSMAWGGEVAYRSQYLPLAESARGRDQLALCVEACRRYGVECHVWKINYNLARCPPNLLAKFTGQGRLVKDCHLRPMRWLCPGHPLNLELERTIMLEIVRRYDVDGIHFDFIRFPRADTCFCDRCRHSFEVQQGRKYPDWPDDLIGSPAYATYRARREQMVTRLVKQVSQMAHRIKPRLKVSAAVLPGLADEALPVGQNWLRWVQENYLDFLCPMDYNTDTGHLARQIARQVRAVGGKLPLYVGLGSWVLQDVSDLVEQISRARELGADGYVLFHGDDMTLAEEWMPQMRNGPTAINAVTPHSCPLAALRLGRGVQNRGSYPVATAGRPFSVTAWIASGWSVRGAWVQLHSLDGQVVDQGVRLYPDRRRVVTFTAPPGQYRPAIVGQAGGRPFAYRGQIVTVK